MSRSSAAGKLSKAGVNTPQLAAVKFIECKQNNTELERIDNQSMRSIFGKGVGYDRK